MSDRTDLHTHSTASDGKLRPSEVVRLAGQSGVAKLALTDHDTTDGVIEAQRAGAELGVEVIAGIEINSEGEHGDAHILGYFVDPSEPKLQEHLEAIRDARVGRAKGMLKKLAELGMPLEWKHVMAMAGDAVSIARPHVARAMVAPGGDAAIPDPPATASFADVPTTFWAYKHVEFCVDQNIVQRYDDGLYHPERVVTRDQMAVYIARAFGLL